MAVPDAQRDFAMEEEFNFAIMAKDMKEVEALISQGADVNKEYRGCAPLIWALRDSTPEIVRILIERGAHPDTMDESNIPVLNIVIYDKLLDIASLLVHNKANVNAFDKQRETPLMTIIKSVASHDEKEANARDGFKSSLMFAQLLIDHSADVDAMDYFGTPVLIHAVVKKQVEMAKLLIKNGVDVNVASVCGKSALQWARDTHQIELQQILLSAGSLEPTPRVASPPKPSVWTRLVQWCRGKRKIN